MPSRTTSLAQLSPTPARRLESRSAFQRSSELRAAERRRRESLAYLNGRRQFEEALDRLWETGERR